MTSMRGFEKLVLALALVLFTYMILAFGIRFDIPDLANVYDVRAGYNEAVATSGLPFSAYVVDWSLVVTGPMLMLLGLRSRRYRLSVVGLAIEILGYGITGYKSALLAVGLLIPLTVLLSTRQQRAFGLTFSAASVAMVLGATTVDQLADTIIATSLFVRRLIVVPGQLVADYYDFFSQQPTYGLSHSILGFLGPAPYNLGPPNLIGSVYFGNAAESANANFWADGFANFGFIGILTFTFGLGLVLVALDGAASGRDLRITGAMTGLLGVTLSNSALLTTILSHGLGLLFILILLMPQDVESDASSSEGDRFSSGGRSEPMPISG